MREIKFRAWDGVGNMEFFTLSSDWINKKYIAENEPVMQYTGMVDYKRAPIYEGDIVAVTLARHRLDGKQPVYRRAVKQVVYKPGGFCIQNSRRAHFTAKHVLCPVKVHKMQLEVIGNIYENPELLESAA